MKTINLEYRKFIIGKYHRYYIINISKLPFILLFYIGLNLIEFNLFKEILNNINLALLNINHENSTIQSFAIEKIKYNYQYILKEEKCQYSI
jgi:hypothetical protein